MRKLYAAVTVAALLAVSCTPLGGAGTLTVGAIYPTGGGQGPGGIEELHGVELAAAMVNERGGVAGRRIQIRKERGDSAEAAPGSVRRLAEAQVPVVLGSYGSTISKPAAAAAARHGLVFWETGAVGELGMQAAEGEWTFRFPPTGDALGRAAVTFVRDRLSGDADLRYAVAYVDDVYGRPVGQGALAEIAESGLEVSADIPYELQTADYDAIAQQVAETRSDVLVVAAYLDDGIALREAILRHQVPLVANIGTSSSYCMIEFGEQLGDDAVGLFASDKPDAAMVRPDALDADAAAVLEQAQQRYLDLHGAAMTAPALSGFAGAWALFNHVLPNARDLTPEAIADAAREAGLPKGSLPNGSGLRFGKPGTPGQGSNLEATSVIWEWVAPGQREVVYPPAFATTEPR